LKIYLYQHYIFIFRRGGKPCIADIHGDLPLHHAVRCKHEEVVDVFLDFYPSSYKVMLYMCHIKSCLPLHHCLSGSLVWLAGFMVLNPTFNNISVILWPSVLLVEETGGHGENHRPV